MEQDTGIVGGVCMAHAPQFFTLPSSEDMNTVKRVKNLAKQNGKQLKELKPDITITVANDHANQFLLHCVPAFAIHHGNKASGKFAGKKFDYAVENEIAIDLIKHLQDEKFDPAFTSNAELDYAFGIPLTFLEISGPIIPIYVNAYVPPQPSMERCYHFGEAINRALKAIGKRGVVVASGGLSHFPGTERYANPATEFDMKLMAEIATGNLRWLLSLGEQILDKTGNIELRCWAVAAGMLGERVPDVVSFDPSWHHNYATFGWWEQDYIAETDLHYPPVYPERVELTSALHKIANDEEERVKFISNRKQYAAEYELTKIERDALVNMDEQTFISLGIHPFVPFMAKLQLSRKKAD
tara:strand:- start:35 stop:1099 length:1065 start_codon:yes stop_codon:yes gene_type:complete